MKNTLILIDRQSTYIRVTQGREEPVLTDFNRDE